jgi:hypothetical protein
MSTLHLQFPRYVFARRSGRPEQVATPASWRRKESAQRAEPRPAAQGATADTETSAILGYN